MNEQEQYASIEKSIRELKKYKNKERAFIIKNPLAIVMALEIILERLKKEEGIR